MKRKKIVSPISKTLSQIDVVSHRLQALRSALARGEHVTQHQLATLEEQLERLWEQRRNEMAVEFAAKFSLEDINVSGSLNETVAKENFRRSHKKSASRPRGRKRTL
jgi:hypothetical protein